MIWECCKNCICDSCKNKETINYKLPEYYCENCDLCDLGDYGRKKCAGFVDMNDKPVIHTPKYVTFHEAKSIDGPYRIDIKKLSVGRRIKKI